MLRAPLFHKVMETQSRHIICPVPGRLAQEDGGPEDTGVRGNERSSSTEAPCRNGAVLRRERHLSG